MINLLFLLASTCPETKMVNKTEYPWNAHDHETMAYCQKRCPELDKADFCLKIFIKWGIQDYHCLCGKP